MIKQKSDQEYKCPEKVVLKPTSDQTNKWSRHKVIKQNKWANKHVIKKQVIKKTSDKETKTMQWVYRWAKERKKEQTKERNVNTRARDKNKETSYG